MAPKSKSIWRDPSAQHFQVVHRSQRDPLINDQDAGSHVLKQFTPKHSSSSTSTTTTSTGNTLSDLQQELQAQGVKERPNVGQASLYGVYYDDTQYDYMQHLRPIGGNYHSQRGGKDEENDVSAILLEAPQKGKNQKGKAKDKVDEEEDFKMDGFQLKDSEKDKKKEQMILPKEVLPNQNELTLEQSRRNQLNIDPALQGLQPDMDPHLRQVLEALDDEAFDFEKARKNLKKSKTHQKSLESRGIEEKGVEKEVVKEEVGEDQDEEEEELDFDDFLAGIIKEGQQDENDQEPEWKALPPGGEESIWLDADERALLKSKSKNFQSQVDASDEDNQTEIGIQQDESIPDIPQDPSSSSGGDVTVDDDGISLSARIALFKKAQKLESQLQSQDSTKPKVNGVAGGSRIAPSVAGSQTSIFSDTKKKSKPGTKARLGASSMAGSQAGDGASAWSMSSSAMFRNEGLKGLDDRFDRLEQLYEEEEEELSSEEDDFPSDEDDESSLPPPPSREDLDTILDDFLDKYELLGGKMKPLLGSKDSTPAEKLSLLRKELGGARIGGKEWKVGEGNQYVRKQDEEEDEEYESEDETPLPMPRMVGENREKWDVETVLSTRTNAENHPRILPLGSSIAGGSTTSNRPVSIAASSYLAGSIAGSRLTSSGAERMPKVKVDPRTGLTQIVGWEKSQKRRDNGEGSVVGDKVEDVENEDEDGEVDYDSDVTEGPRNFTITRPRNEDKDEKKARKAAAKEEKQARRQAKSNMKAAFAEERKRLNQSEIQRTKDGGAADIGRNGIKMRGGATAIRLN